MAIEAGQQLLHYRLIEKIGEGGMGVVWKAVDTTLDREIALKVLPDTFSSDPERLIRFEREAKLLASLQHPNIAAVFGLHEAGELRFLAMEYVPGEDLAEQLQRGPLPVELRVLGLPDDTHPALADLLDQAVVEQLLSGFEGHASVSPRESKPRVYSVTAESPPPTQILRVGRTTERRSQVLYPVELRTIATC